MPLVITAALRLSPTGIEEAMNNPFTPSFA